MDQRPIDRTSGDKTAGDLNPGLHVNRPDRPASQGRRAARLGQPVRPAETPGGTPADRPAATGPAFQALLDKLSRSARELQEKADAVERPSDLAGAVGEAKASLDEALSLGRDLLEAWRAEQTNSPNRESDR